MKKIISCENVVKSFGENELNRVVLDHISFDIIEGEFVSVMGASGSGKSTLLYAVSGIDTVDSGEIYFRDKCITSLSDNELSDIRRTQMGFVFQQPTLLKNLSILDNIILPSVKGNEKIVDSIKTKAMDLMVEMGIKELANRSINQASGGQLQRVGICRALIGDPHIIFCDEPTGALNSKASELIVDILNNINSKGTTIMLVTHDPKIAAKSERVLFMHDGVIVKELMLGKPTATSFDVNLEKIEEAMKSLGV